jgi:hypothetical protein
MLKPPLTSCIWRPNFLCLRADKGTMLSHIFHARKSKARLRSFWRSMQELHRKKAGLRELGRPVSAITYHSPVDLQYGDLGRLDTKNVSCVTHTDAHSLLGRQGHGTQRLLAPVAKSISICVSAQALKISAFKAPRAIYATSIQAVEGTAGKLCDRDYLTRQASMWRHPFPTLNCLIIMKADFCEAVGEVKT